METTADSLAEMIASQGFAVVEGGISAGRARRLRAAIKPAIDRLARRRGGIRNLQEAVPEVAEMALSPDLLALVRPVLGACCLLTRAILFEKTRRANWSVPWHQDLAVAVKHRVDAPGYSGWSVKAGVPHVPARIGCSSRWSPCGSIWTISVLKTARCA